MPTPHLLSPIAVEEIFRVAAALPAAERAAYLDAACQGQPAVRARVERMLEVGGIAALLQRGADETVPPEIEAELARLKPEDGGEQIGNYKLLQKIGQGGFGVVWMAEQIEPVRRRVALKIIKLGMDTKEVIARFEQERQALAMMDHPNIAKVFDAGVTPTGRSFFVMELVRGIKITDYCDQANLSTAERLALFIAVCHAVQHAHQKGIIHRDLKPSNILVTLHDGVPVPKVIDFGVAKATQSARLTDLTFFTQFEQMIGTPLYMSPEQAEMSGLDIDTRSDIYSLGVLLYELLSGRTPFDPQELMRKGQDEMRRAIREQEPPRPSTALHTMAADARTTIAQHRQADGAKLIGLITGDLDWIVMKCLEKDRMRRYETANGLAADLMRHLDNEPVAARPPSAAYRLQKAWRRNKLVFTAGAAVVAALVAGLSLAAFGWRQTRVERDKALQAKAQAESARGQAEKSQQAEYQQRQRAVHGETEALRLLYVATMSPAQQAWEQNDVGRLRQLLDETKESRSRGFEWYYWQRQLHLDLTTLRGHLEEVSSVAFSPDGQRIVTGSRDATAKVWEAASGKELLTLKGHGAPIWSVAFSPDGQRIVTGSDDQTAKVWEAASGLVLLTLKGHSGPVYAVAFSPDGLRIVTGSSSSDHTAKVWATASGKELLTLGGHRGNVTSVAFSPDGQRIVTGTWDQEAKVWETVHGRELLTLGGDSHATAVSAAFSPDGQRIVTGSRDATAAKVWEAASGKELLTLKGHSAWIWSVAFSPDGQRIVTGSKDQTAKVWDAASGLVLLTHKGHSGAVRSVAFSPDGQRIVTGSWDNTAKVWAAAGAREPLNLNGHSGVVRSVAFSPDGQRIVTGSWDHTAKVWAAATGQELLTINGASSPVAFSPDGRRIVTGSRAKMGKVWEAASGRELLTLKGYIGGISSVAFSPDGHRIVMGSDDNTARVWDAANGKEVLALKGHENPLNVVAFSPDGQRIVTGSWDQTAKVWDAAGGGEQLTLRGHSQGIGSAAFSPDGQRIVTGSWDATAKVWDAASGKELLTLRGHSQGIWTVAFSPDGERIVTGSRDATAKVWEADSGKELLTLKGHEAQIWSVAFSPDGQRIVTGSLDKTAKVWEAATATQVAAWQTEEHAAKQRLALLRPEAEAEAKSAAETWSREIAASAGAPESAPQHKPPMQERPVIPGDSGLIRQWLVLAPFPFEGGADLNVLKQQIPNEARLHPGAGDRPPEAPAGLAWTSVQLDETSYRLDFVDLVNKALPGSDTYQQVAYAVSYVVSEKTQTGLMLLVSSDDTARIYLNEKEIYRQLSPKCWGLDCDEVSGVELKAGLNVIVFKVANGSGPWGGSVRFIDAAGQPVKGIKVTLDPEAKD